MELSRLYALLGLPFTLLLACSDSNNAANGPAGADAGANAGPPIYSYANGCHVLRSEDGHFLAANRAGDRYELAVTDASAASRFFMKASDLGTYLLYDQEGGYVLAEDGPLLRQVILQSDLLLLDDTYVSGAEWEISEAAQNPLRVRLRHRKTQAFLGQAGVAGAEADAIVFSVETATDCAQHPELTLDAEGKAKKTTFDDGELYGIVDSHSHILSNFGFGGGGIFHGSPFHRLGVEHALPDCDVFHGDKGRKDFFGYGFDSGSGGLDTQSLLSVITAGELAQDNHATDGYPTFSAWPNGPSSSTHQTQYYLWLERAFLAGLRLVVLHATTNQIICDFTAGQGLQKVRYACNDMVAVDRILEESHKMERYIDAQTGGPGKGFFRLVETPEQARKVIKAGKMAVVLGIETSNLFDCFSTPHEGAPTCDEAYIKEQLDEYYIRGVRVMFPVHKYDNAFTAGDGHKGFIELGNFINSGHWSNFVEDGCLTDVPPNFDRGNLSFKGLNMPRDKYDAPPPNDMSGFADQPVETLTPHLGLIQQGGQDGDFCQNAGMTQLGETLVREMMLRGMVIEVDHFPRRSYKRVFELLEEADYPAAGTHGSNYGGRLYALGGISKTGLGRCRDPQNKGTMTVDLGTRVALKVANGGHPSEGFGFDLNGFAGAPGPRFGDRAGCAQPQDNPVTYPFTSYAGDVTFTQPRLGDRRPDFNTEGLVHIGMLPELIQDARADAKSDADLEPLFRSAEGYLRMWEKAEARGKVLLRPRGSDAGP